MSEVIFNLDTGSLSDYEIGSLAPDEFNNEHQRNFEDGYGIYVTDGRVTSILVCFRNGYRSFNQFKGIVLINGKEHRFHEHSSYEEVIAIFGEPNKHWNDGVEMCADYTKNGKDIEIIWHVDEGTTLDYISVEID